jgi:hypothetical protein
MIWLQTVGFTPVACLMEVKMSNCNKCGLLDVLEPKKSQPRLTKAGKAARPNGHAAGG